MPGNIRSIGFVGAGTMAEALISSIIKSGIIDAAAIWASDINTDRGSYLTERYGINFLRDNKELVKKSEVVIYAVKPHMLSAVLEEVAPYVSEKNVHISIAAGISTETIEKQLPSGSAVIRVMPNTPCLVSAGASAYVMGGNATPEHEQVVKQILDCTGESVKIEEKLINAVTGVSGSGPAYVFLIIEALTDAGVKAGLPRNVASILAVQTVLGSAMMVKETGEHPAKLKDMVTTPGGTTIAALHVLENGRIRGTLIDAVLAAVSRAEELGSGK